MKAIINNKEYTIKQKESEPFLYEVNGTAVQLDTHSPQKGILQILYNNHPYRAELLSYNEEDKIALVKINNTRYEIKIKDDTDALLEQLGISSKTPKVLSIKAPMPGLVLDVRVKEGDTVNKGDGLLVLEAMKMENLIKAQTPGKVKKIHIAKGNKVEKNQPMIEME